MIHLSRTNQFLALIFFGVLFGLLSIVYLFQVREPKDARAGWFNDHFAHRQRIPVSNSSGEEKTDFQLELELDTATLITAGQMQSNCADIRFTNITGNELSYWLEPNTCNTSTTKVFVKVDTIPTSGTDIYWYYGSPSLNSAPRTSADVAADVFDKVIDGAVANWPLDDEDPTQSYARVINQGKELGRDIVINGGFDVDANWGKGAGWSINDGMGTNDGSDSTYKSLTQTLPISSGKAYQIRYTISDYSSGAMRLRLGYSTSGETRNSNGTFTETLVAGTTNTALYFEAAPSFTGSVDNVTVRQVDIPSSSSIDSSQELLVDGDMEAADTSAWTANPQATLSKESTSPQSGSQVMRIVTNGSVYAWAEQTVVDAGKSYRFSGYARSDGFALPRIATAGNSLAFTGTNSTNWQYYNRTFNQGHTGLIAIETFQGAAGQYVDWDNVSLVEVPPMVGRNTNGITVGADANGHLSKAYSFDGTNDLVNIYSSDLNSVFNPEEGTIVAWAKVSDAGVWTDSTTRVILRIVSDANNAIEIYKRSTNDQLYVGYASGGVAKRVIINPVNSTGWIQLAISWNKSGDEVKVFMSGVQQGSTLTDLSNWTGNISTTQAIIGATNSSGTSPWKGLINDVRLYDRALSADEIASMYSADTDVQVYATDNLPGKEMIRDFDPSITLGTFGDAETGPGPVAHWSLDSLEGTTVRDQSGNENNGTNNGATLLTEDQCISGKCMRFDGVDDRIEVPNDDTLNPDSEITVSLWVKPNEGYGNVGNPGLVSKKNSWGGVWVNKSTGLLWGRIYGQNQLNLPQNEILPANKWSHVVFIADSNTNKLYLYLNGALISESGSYTTPLRSSTDVLLIGLQEADYLKGTIDEVKIYPYARTAEEIKMDYLAGASSAGSGVVLGDSDQSFLSEGLVGYWKMDPAPEDGAGQVRDYSGNNNHGTFQNGATYGAGKYGSGGSFDGVDDYVRISDDESLNVSYQGNTISSWVKIPPEHSSSTHVFSNYGSNVNNTASLLILSQGRARCVYRDSDLDAITVDGTTDLRGSDWDHLVCTKNGNKVELYVNGVLEVSGSNDAVDEIITTGLAKNIGKNATGFSNSFVGSIDETRIYNRALSPAEVRALYEYAPGPVGHWKFDPAPDDAGQVMDSSGYGNHGTLVNGPEYVPGKIGGALEFDGVDQHFYVNTGSSLKMGLSNWTTQAWIRTSSDQGSHIITDKRDAGPSDRYQMRLVNGKLFAELRHTNSDMVNLTSTSDIADGEWHYVVATYSRDSDLKIYIDGILEGSVSITDYENIYIDSTNPFRVGTSSYNPNTPDTSTHFPGLIDDVRIYNYARTADQIREDMLAGSPIETSSVEDPKPEAETIDFATGDMRDDIIDGPGADPIAYWNFNERTGTTLVDQTENGNDGTLVNGPEWVSGKYGAGLAFDKNNLQHVLTTGGTNQAYANEVTVTAWIRRSEAISTTYEWIMARGTGSNLDYGLTFIGPTANRFRFFREGGGIHIDSLTTDSLNDNQWHQVTAIFSSITDEVKFYVDGNEIGTGSSSGSWTYNPLPTDRTDYIIGAYNPSLFNFNGVIDEVKIFDYALTPAQVAYEYNKGEPIGHWMMDECQGTTIHDASGNENHGTLVIGSGGSGTSVGTCETAGTAWGNGKTGKLNSSMSFDGVDDYVEIPDDDIFDLTSRGSFSLWVKNSQIDSGINFIRVLNKKSAWNSPDGYNVQIHNGGRIQVVGSNTNSAIVTVLPNGWDDQWHHVVVTLGNNGNQANVYFDGEYKGSGTIDAPIANTTPINFGRIDSTYYTGQIDDVRIYNYALSDKQVRTLYNNGAVNFR